MYQNSPYKRERVDDPEGYGPPQKRFAFTPGLSNSMALLDLQDKISQSVGDHRFSIGIFMDLAKAFDTMGLSPAGYGGAGPSGARASASYNYPSPKASPRAPGHGEDKPNNVLLFTIFNPKYPITVDVMHSICSSGNLTVNRIVIFRKNGVQAMVEFDTVEAALAAKEALNGADIYSGCCTLKIDWGKPTRLNVVKNDQDSWDYTVPSLGKQLDKDPSKGQPLLPDPKISIGGGAPYGIADGPPRRGPPPLQADYGYEAYPGQADGYDPYRRMPSAGERFPQGPMPLVHRPQVDVYGHEAYGPPPPRPRLPYRGPPPASAMHGQQQPGSLAAGYDDGSGSMLQQGSVLMVYGLNNEKMNCQRVFNLFCLYGNVVRVKFLKSKDGVAMVQLGDNASCERSIKNINGSFVFGHKMLMGYSKQAFIQDVPNPVDLPDGSVSFMDFMGNRNNRFTTPEAAAKNRIQPASKVLYFFNAPPGIKEADLAKVFVDCDVKRPTKMKIFPSKTERSSTGLLEWDNKGECVEALVAANHTPIPNPSGKNPYILKFCFSDAPIKG